MQSIILNDQEKQHFLQLHEPTEIRDQQGKLIGTFIPTENYSEYDNQKIPQHILDKFDPVELERRMKSSHPGYTIEQVREHLRSLERRTA